MNFSHALTQLNLFSNMRNVRTASASAATDQVDGAKSAAKQPVQKMQADAPQDPKMYSEHATASG